MKQILSLFIFLSTISFIALSSSCTDINIIGGDNAEATLSTDTVTNYSITGKWLLIQVNFGFGGIRNCSEKNVEYQFLDTGKLKVSDDSEEDGRGIFLTRGEHQYALNKKTSQITIDRFTYQYRIEDKKLIIDTGSAWDAPVYVFKLIKNDL